MRCIRVGLTGTTHDEQVTFLQLLRTAFAAPDAPVADTSYLNVYTTTVAVSENVELLVTLTHEPICYAGLYAHAHVMLHLVNGSFAHENFIPDLIAVAETTALVEPPSKSPPLLAVIQIECDPTLPREDVCDSARITERVSERYLREGVNLWPVLLRNYADVRLAVAPFPGRTMGPPDARYSATHAATEMLHGLMMWITAAL